jgi:hypothetical protein
MNLKNRALIFESRILFINNLYAYGGGGRGGEEK